MTIVVQLKRAPAAARPAFAGMMGFAEFNPVLAMPTRWGYAARVPEKKGTGLGRLRATKAHKPRNAVFFRAYAFVCLLWAAMAGTPPGVLVSFCAPVGQPRHLPLSPFGRGARFNRTKEAYMPGSTRTLEHSSTPLCINELALQSARSAVDMPSLGASCVDELGSFFTAIISLSAENDAICKLAKIGLEWVDQHYETFDLNNKSAKEQLAAIRAAAGGAHA